MGGEVDEVLRKREREGSVKSAQGCEVEDWLGRRYKRGRWALGMWD